MRKIDITRVKVEDTPFRSTFSAVSLSARSCEPFPHKKGPLPENTFDKYKRIDLYCEDFGYDWSYEPQHGSLLSFEMRSTIIGQKLWDQFRCGE
jgi:hypothetical protein